MFFGAHRNSPYRGGVEKNIVRMKKKWYAREICFFGGVGERGTGRFVLFGQSVFECGVFVFRDH
jgi:hypothetical protein